MVGSAWWGLGWAAGLDSPTARVRTGSQGAAAEQHASSLGQGLLRPAAPSAAARPRQGPPRPASSSPRPVLTGPGRGRPESGGSSPGRNGAGCVWERRDFLTVAGPELGRGGQEGAAAESLFRQSCTTSVGRACLLPPLPPPAGHLWTLRLGASQSRSLHPTRKRQKAYSEGPRERFCAEVSKRWKKSWFVLYPASPHGVARLEFFECKEGAAPADRISTKRPDKKIVRLADCVSVAPALDCSPKEGLAAFYLETSSRTYIFATEPQEAADWVAKLCEAAFLTNPGKMTPSATEIVGERDLEMATNSIYYSREEVNEFWVTVQKTEAAERCKLQGRYVLKASWNKLVLREAPSSLPLYTWPYRLLRRYGRDKVMFSFEAGRRCESGPGNFTFETKQGNEIFHVVEAAIQAQKAQVEEHRQSSSSLEMETPGVFSLQNAMTNSLSLDGEGAAAAASERRAPRSTLAARASVAGEGKETAVPKGQNPWPSSLLRPSLSGMASSLEDTNNVYSEPLDAVKGSRLQPDSLYADPVDSQHQEEGPGWGSGLAEEQPRSGTCEGHGVPSGKQHIYDEPEGRAPWPTPTSAAIYDEARLPCEAWRTQGLESQAGYELPCLPGTGDYAVPAFHQKAGLKSPRPSPAPKPPRVHKKSTQLEASKPRAAPTLGPEGVRNSNNSNNGSDPLYSRVLKLPSAPGPLGPEQSVDESRPPAVYEDLGEI